ncbi:MAG: RNA polymerase sigma factor [Actinomycetota bacterium]
MREPEPEIVRRAREGDLGAFEELVRLYQGEVYRLALHLVRDRELAEDVAQDAFIAAFRSLRSFRGRSKFSTWLFRITRNCSVDAIRKASRQRRLVEQVEVEPPAPDAALRAALREAIDGLPAELREAFVLIEVFGFSYREASDVLGVPGGTVKSRMHRARRLLVDELGEAEGADEV